ncbi:hypothetical protein [Acinetobacter thermotolerans]|uniref:hypothetical protein n=1 Tax=Acinetobacter thermotolerans TaxID=3151487 RepID=UPI00325C1381
MTLKYKMSGIALLAGLLTACGGGSGSSSESASSNLPENLPDAISPELPDDFVPFTDETILDKIKNAITGQDGTSELANNYNEALAHMVGEIFADYPLGRTGRALQVYNLGVNSIKIGNLTCAEVNTNGNTKTLTLKPNKETCIVLDKTFVAGSKITQTVNSDTTTVTFDNVRYGHNLDFSLKDQYLISGSIRYTSSKSSLGKERKYDISNLSFQRVKTDSNKLTEVDVYNADSREYLQLKDYSFSLVDDFGSGSNGTRTLHSKGTVIGQPLDAKFRYTFSFDTGSTPFIMNEISLNNYHHLPEQGSVNITHKKGLFDNELITKIRQDEPRSLKAGVYLGNTKVDDILWSSIIGK